MRSYARFENAVFRPNGLRWFLWCLSGGVALKGKAFGCLECGLIWTAVPPQKLNSFVQRKCEPGSGGPHR